MLANGQSLKICFLLIVFTLCAVVLFLVTGIVFFKFPLDESKSMLGMLGISALFGGITQAFIHSNIAEAMKAPGAPVEAPAAPPALAVVTEAAKPPGSPGQASLNGILGLCLAALLGFGCASYGINHMHGTANGAFVYNGVPVVGNVQVDHWGCVGFECQQANMTEIINATANSGSAENTAK